MIFIFVSIRILSIKMTRRQIKIFKSIVVCRQLPDNLCPIVITCVTLRRLWSANARLFTYICCILMQRVTKTKKILRTLRSDRKIKPACYKLQLAKQQLYFPFMFAGVSLSHINHVIDVNVKVIAGHSHDLAYNLLPSFHHGWLAQHLLNYCLLTCHLEKLECW